MEGIGLLAREAGFAVAGVARPRPLDEDERAFARWIGRSFHGTMRFLEREPERRFRPETLLASARSVIVLGVPYFPGDPPAPSGAHARVSMFAWGKDYHEIIGGRLSALISRLRERFGAKAAFRPFVDAGPVAEKSWAREAGIGGIGKNTLLIAPGVGSYVFLAVVLTDLELWSRTPPFPLSPLPLSASRDPCGGCTLCLDACPTRALVEPRVLDARRCISYLTIEHRGEIDPALAGRMGDWAYGCDVCQEVCPHNPAGTIADEPEFWPSAGPGSHLPLDAAEGLSEGAFRKKFGGTSLARAGRRRIARNLEIVRKNIAGESVNG
ncbi:MAG: tRNA epoxyqueuosine(34) reductase QueG [Nitrospirae bacterium]|nr:tRNA epoxyqueuosine(34) reductase QueG [Nitrospirota bacterium]